MIGMLRSVRRLMRSCAGALAAGLALPLLIAAPAAAKTSQSGSPGPLRLAITSVNPAYARPGERLTVRGTVGNVSGEPQAGIMVQLRSGRSRFGNRDSLQLYADGSLSADSPVPGATAAIGTLAAGASRTWQIRVSAKTLGLSLFGVYPLSAEADQNGVPAATEHTFLPFWPGKKALDPVREQVAWVWPLVDLPRQLHCPSMLLNSGLAAAISGNGRLAGLLAAGQRYGRQARITWAIDPALLRSADTMTRPYRVGGSAQCQGGTSHPASTAARAWLSRLLSATRAEPVLVTPYADVDIAALTRHSLDSDLVTAFAEGRAEASRILHRTFSASGHNSALALSGYAWPPGGRASYPVLESLAGRAGISALVLSSAAMPPKSTAVNFTPSAQLSVPDGVGTRMHVLLADQVISQQLAARPPVSSAAGAAFATSQRFLAETAMIAAERIRLRRSVVVAPPRQWDPGAGLAASLLRDTVKAPWMRAVSLPELAARKPGAAQVPRSLNAGTGGGLSSGLVAQIKRLDRQVQLLQSIQVRPDPNLGYAVAAVESSAWDGRRAARQAESLLARVSDYVTGQPAGLAITGSPRVTLGGQKGTLLVSISNRLGYQVRVRLRVTGPPGVTVKYPHQPILAAAGTDTPVKVGVSASSVGSSNLTLTLLTPHGARLPIPQVTMAVQATHFGKLALVIIAAALAVFLIASATRAIRRGRPGTGGSGGPPSRAGPRSGAVPAPEDRPNPAATAAPASVLPEAHTSDRAESQDWRGDATP
jgi:hypothetical protein